MRTGILLGNGLLLALTLALFRVEAAANLGPVVSAALSATEWIQLLAPELGFAVAFEAAWFLADALPWAPARRLVRALFVPAHVIVLLLAALAQQFLLVTGTEPSPDLVLYALAHVWGLRGLIGSGLDWGFLARLCPILLCLALGRSREHPAPPTRPTHGAPRVGWRRPAIPGAVAGLLAGTVALLGVPPVAALPFHSGSLVALVRAPRSEPVGVIRSTEIYRPPQLLDLATTRTPNFLLIILESFRTDHTAPYAGADAAGITPSLDRLGRRSLVVEHVYTTVSHTTKALVGILCGMYPVLQMRLFETRPGQVMLHCLPHLLEPLGYRTAFMQSADGTFEARRRLLANFGFQLAVVEQDLPAQGFPRVGYLGLDDFAMLAPALRWIETGGDAPWFLSLLTVSTHHPYETPASGPATGRQQHARFYANAVHHVDRFVGTLLETLERSGQLDDTVVIIVGDHGEAFGEHGRRQHDAVPYEEVVRVPLLIHGPDWLGPPRRIHGLRHHVDLVPTVLDILGIRWRGLLPGRSLLADTSHDYVVSSCWYTRRCMSLRSGSMKYVYHFGERSTEAFDLEVDPLETRDLASELPRQLVAAAESRILSLRASVHDYYAGQKRRMFRHEVEAAPAP